MAPNPLGLEVGGFAQSTSTGNGVTTDAESPEGLLLPHLTTLSIWINQHGSPT